MGNPIAHWELMVNDLEKGMAFYKGVFDWQIDETDYPGYYMISTGAEPGGGMMARPDQAPAAALNSYFMVDDIDDTLAKAEAAGATVIAPRTPIPGMGSWAMFADPDGIPIGIFQEE